MKDEELRERLEKEGEKDIEGKKMKQARMRQKENEQRRKRESVKEKEREYESKIRKYSHHQEIFKKKK